MMRVAAAAGATTRTPVSKDRRAPMDRARTLREATAQNERRDFAMDTPQCDVNAMGVIANRPPKEVSRARHPVLSARSPRGSGLVSRYDGKLRVLGRLVCLRIIGNMREVNGRFGCFLWAVSWDGAGDQSGAVRKKTSRGFAVE